MGAFNLANLAAMRNLPIGQPPMRAPGFNPNMPPLPVGQPPVQAPGWHPQMPPLTGGQPPQQIYPGGVMPGPSLLGVPPRIAPGWPGGQIDPRLMNLMALRQMMPNDMMSTY